MNNPFDALTLNQLQIAGNLAIVGLGFALYKIWKFAFKRNR